MKNIVLMSVFAFLLASALVFTPKAQPVKATSTIIIVPDNYPTIQAAIDAASGGDSARADGIIVERDNIIVDGAGHTIQGNKSGNGIDLSERNNVTIKNIQITFQRTPLTEWDGIYLLNSCNNNIFGNDITGSDLGISLQYSNNNTISGNNLSNNGYGIYGFDSLRNVISANNITDNGYGISGFGIDFVYSINNTISGNNIIHNGYGIYLYESSDNNCIYHNNLINNTQQVSSQNSTNIWDNGCEGNYWNNYNGSDSDGDGVADNSSLPWEGVDNCPLMNLYWNPCDINHDLKVDMKDIGKSAKAFDTRPDNANWNQHADITGLEPLVPDGNVNMRDISLIASHYSRKALFPFVGSKESTERVYHYPYCTYALRMKTENKIWFSSSEDARKQNYRPCEICKPP